jgi:hypothetical protein
MILFIQCVMCCLLFTLAILPTQYKDPINMIISYPPKIRQRVEELPQYKGMIKQRKKLMQSKKNIRVNIFCCEYLWFDCFRLRVFCHSKKLRISGQKIWKKNIKIICSMREVLVLELF